MKAKKDSSSDKKAKVAKPKKAATRRVKKAVVPQKQNLPAEQSDDELFEAAFAGILAKEVDVEDEVIDLDAEWDTATDPLTGFVWQVEDLSLSDADFAEMKRAQYLLWAKKYTS